MQCLKGDKNNGVFNNLSLGNAPDPHQWLMWMWNLIGWKKLPLEAFIICLRAHQTFMNSPNCTFVTATFLCLDHLNCMWKCIYVSLNTDRSYVIAQVYQSIKKKKKDFFLWLVLHNPGWLWVILKVSFLPESSLALFLIICFIFQVIG